MSLEQIVFPLISFKLHFFLGECWLSRFFIIIFYFSIRFPSFLLPNDHNNNHHQLKCSPRTVLSINSNGAQNCKTILIDLDLSNQLNAFFCALLYFVDVPRRRDEGETIYFIHISNPASHDDKSWKNVSPRLLRICCYFVVHPSKFWCSWNVHKHCTFFVFRISANTAD